MLKHINYFNRAALTYDQQSNVQQKIGQQLIAYLNKTPIPARVIDLGCGTGIVTAKLAQYLPNSKLIALDLAEQLLAVATKRLTPFDIQIKQANFDLLIEHPFYDLVFSNMALHWSNNFNNILQTIKKILKPQGQIAFSIPLQHTFNELKPYFAVHRFMRHADIIAHLQDLNYQIEIEHQETLLETYTNTLATLRSLKYTGVNFCAQRTTKSLKKIHFPDSIQTLTYHVGFYVARPR